MKKSMKKLVATAVIILALIGTTAVGLAAAGYITWGGTNDYNQAMHNLGLIKVGVNDIKSERDLANASNDELRQEIGNRDNAIADKENIILDKDNLINAKQQEIDALKQQVTNSQTTQNQLLQAEIDMASVNQETAAVLSEVN